jgi:hypothetical protein
VVLSPTSECEFIANYQDGTSEYALQASWMHKVTEQVQLLQLNLANMMQMAALDQSARYSAAISRNAAANAYYSQQLVTYSQQVGADLIGRGIF